MERESLVQEHRLYTASSLAALRGSSGSPDSSPSPARTSVLRERGQLSPWRAHGTCRMPILPTHTPSSVKDRRLHWPFICLGERRVPTRGEEDKGAERKKKMAGSVAKSTLLAPTGRKGQVSSAIGCSGGVDRPCGFIITGNAPVVAFAWTSSIDSCDRSRLGFD